MAEAIITLPDGRKAKLTGPNRDAIMAQAQQLKQGQIIPQTDAKSMTADLRQQLVPGVPGTELSGVSTTDPDRGGFWKALGRRGGERFVDNVLVGSANALANVPRRIPAQLGITGPKGALEATDTRSLSDLIAPTSRTVPSLSERVLPLPSGEQIVAGAETAAEVPGAALQGQDINLSQMFGRNMADAQALARENPGGAVAGEIAGDIGTLITGRMPVARILSRRPKNLPHISERQVADTLEAIGRSNPSLAPRVAELIGSGRLAAPGASRLFQRAFQSDAARSVARGAGKSLETGLEGMVLGILSDGDPLEMAGLSAGGQMASSIVGSLFGVPASLKGLAVRAATYTAAFRLSQDLIPGGDEDVYRAIDSGFSKVALGMTAGLLSQIVGGRFRGSRVGSRFAEDVPIISDAINTVPRGAILSVLNKIRSEQEHGDNTTMEVMQKLSSDPKFFGPDIGRRLNRALEKGTWDKEIDRLLKNKRFVSRLEELEASNQ